MITAESRLALARERLKRAEDILSVRRGEESAAIMRRQKAVRVVDDATNALEQAEEAFEAEQKTKADN